MELGMRIANGVVLLASFTAPTARHGQNQEPTTGSRVRERACCSRKQLEAIERRAGQYRQTLKKMIRPLGNANGGLTCGHPDRR